MLLLHEYARFLHASQRAPLNVRLRDVHCFLHLAWTNIKKKKIDRPTERSLAQTKNAPHHTRF